MGNLGHEVDGPDPIIDLDAISINAFHIQFDLSALNDLYAYFNDI